MFVVIEIQKNGENASPITTLFDNKEAAYSEYHMILAAAAISNIQEHSAILVSEEGNYILHEKFTHDGGNE